MTDHLAELPAPRRRRRYRRPLVLAAVLCGAALFLLWRFNPGRAALPVCALYATTGLHCPGCGATRATHELLHGRLLAALQDNTFWVLALPLALYGAASEARYLVRGQPLPGNLARKPWLLIAIAVIAVVFFVLRNIPAYPFHLLAPPG